MSERDLAQKLDLRRAFWAMGASTRLDVKLSAIVPRESGRAASQEWTDLDVLAIEYSPLTGLTQTVADCKTIKGGVAERVFWLRGVADLFSARAAYLTRDDPLPPSARQLAVRLGIAALDARDRNVLLEQAGSRGLPRAGTFLEESTFRRWNSLVSPTPRAVERLANYRRTLFWIVPHHRNLTYLVSEVRRVRAQLDPGKPESMVLILDLAWLYLLTVLRALDEMSRLQLADQGIGMRLVLLGGEQEAQRQERIAKELQQFLGVGKDGPALTVNPLPGYYENLSELFARVARRRSDAAEALRALEFVGVETVAAKGATWSEAFPETPLFGPKLASDVVQFLVGACGLDREFVARFDRCLAHRPSVSTQRGAETRPSASSPVQPALFDNDATPEPARSSIEDGPVEGG